MLSWAKERWMGPGARAAANRGGPGAVWPSFRAREPYAGELPKVPLPGRYYRYRLDVIEAFERGDLDPGNGKA